MNDRELLELAAKAAGLEWYGFYGDDEAECKYLDIGPNDVEPWNPLTDDGDALRLVVTLGIDLAVSIAARTTYASKFGHHDDVIEEHDEHGAEAATRRAIVRAAAEIGKAMK